MIVSIITVFWLGPKVESVFGLMSIYFAIFPETEKTKSFNDLFESLFSNVIGTSFCSPLTNWKAAEVATANSFGVALPPPELGFETGVSGALQSGSTPTPHEATHIPSEVS